MAKDKATPPTPTFQVPPDCATREELIGALQYWADRAKTAERIAEECTAQAPTQCPACNATSNEEAEKICIPVEGSCPIVEAGFIGDKWPTQAEFEATPQGTPTECPTCNSAQKWSEATAVAAYNNGRELCHDHWHSSAAECPRCGSKDFWTVLPKCHGGKAHKWHTPRE